MDSEEIINQYIFSTDLCAHIALEAAPIDSFQMLHALASAGIKLCRLDPDSPDDFDEEGTSIVSKAYMYSVVESIELFHINKNDIDEDDLDGKYENKLDLIDIGPIEFELTDEEINDIFDGDQ